MEFSRRGQARLRRHRRPRLRSRPSPPWRCCTAPAWTTPSGRRRRGRSPITDAMCWRSISPAMARSAGPPLDQHRGDGGLGAGLPQGAGRAALPPRRAQHGIAGRARGGGARRARLRGLGPAGLRAGDARPSRSPEGGARGRASRRRADGELELRPARPDRRQPRARPVPAAKRAASHRANAGRESGLRPGRLRCLWQRRQRGAARRLPGPAALGPGRPHDAFRQRRGLRQEFSPGPRQDSARCRPHDDGRAAFAHARFVQDDFSTRISRKSTAPKH